MDVDIIKIGNSKGVRLPKAVLQQVGLDKKARLVVEDGVVKLVPKRSKSINLALMSEPSLAKTWNDPREDEAWKNL